MYEARARKKIGSASLPSEGRAGLWAEALGPESIRDNPFLGKQKSDTCYKENKVQNRRKANSELMFVTFLISKEVTSRWEQKWSSL